MTSELKIALPYDVMQAAQRRIAAIFDHFERIYVSFSGGKDSTVMLHLVMDEAIKRGTKVGVLIIDLEAQYGATIDHMELCVDKYREHLDLYWICLPMALRNAVSNFEPRWICWQPGQTWVRDAAPKEAITDSAYFPFFREGMEFEEFMVEFGLWYSGPGKVPTTAFVGIRADESLNRFRTIASRSKETWRGNQWTTRVEPDANLFNAYPIYDWRVGDLWHYHHLNPTRPYYAQLLLGSLPKSTQEHYLKRFRVFIKWWKKRGYPTDIPDESPPQLENKGLAPSYRRICKVLLRNDYWCKGLKFSQPKSDVYKAFVKQKKAEKHKLKSEDEDDDREESAASRERANRVGACGSLGREP